MLSNDALSYTGMPGFINLGFPESSLSSYHGISECSNFFRYVFFYYVDLLQESNKVVK